MNSVRWFGETTLRPPEGIEWSEGKTLVEGELPGQKSQL